MAHFLSTDIKESSVDLLLSEACRDNNGELELLIGSLSSPMTGGCSPSGVSETSIESGISSPNPFSSGEAFFTGLLGNDLSLFSNSISLPTSESLQTPVVSSTPSVPNSLRVSKVPSGQQIMSSLSQLRETKPCDPTERNRKNAIAARLNRQKKKEYVNGLESEVGHLKTENTTLKCKCFRMEETVATLSTEVQYLKSVLANQSKLSHILQNIPEVNGVRLTGSFRPGKRCREDDFSDNYSSKRVQTVPAQSGGVCLHVVNDVATLEFCSECSKKAAETL